MKAIKGFIIFLALTSLEVNAQQCNEFVNDSSFSQMSFPVFYIEGRSDYYPCIQLKIGANKLEKDVLHIYGTAGSCEQNIHSKTGRDFNNRSQTSPLNATLDLTQLHFSFEDGVTLAVYSESSRIEKNSIFIYRSKHPVLFEHFKNYKLSEIKVVISGVNAEYKIPLLNSTDRKSNQDFFINLFRCLGW